MIKLGNKELIPQGYSKVMKGSSLVWEKSVEKTISFNSLSDISPYTEWIKLPENICSTLKGKKIGEITIDGFSSFIDEKVSINDAYMAMQLSKSIDEFIDATDFIKKGTKITIAYE